jgi:hypothetical protein
MKMETAKGVNEMEGKDMTILGYQIKCANEWCSGPEIWGWRKEKPVEPLRCPTCGYTALPGERQTVKPIYDEMEE